MQLIKYQCRKCRYIFVKLNFNNDGKTAACPRCHHRDLRMQADFTAMPPKGLMEQPDFSKYG
jgi:putative FmdB family regulatory protein